MQNSVVWADYNFQSIFKLIVGWQQLKFVLALFEVLFLFYMILDFCHLNEIEISQCKISELVTDICNLRSFALYCL